MGKLRTGVFETKAKWGTWGHFFWQLCDGEEEGKMGGLGSKYVCFNSSAWSQMFHMFVPATGSLLLRETLAWALPRIQDHGKRGPGWLFVVPVPCLGLITSVLWALRVLLKSSASVVVVVSSSNSISPAFHPERSLSSATQRAQTSEKFSTHLFRPSLSLFSF